jgi:hypothetical protein
MCMSINNTVALLRMLRSGMHGEQVLYSKYIVALTRLFKTAEGDTLESYWGCGKQLESARELKPLCAKPHLLVR